MHNIFGQLQQLKEEKRQLEEAITALGDSDIEKLLLEQKTKLEQLNRETKRLSDQSKTILKSEITLNDRLCELEYMQERFSVLASGYQSDMERLEFIIDGENAQPKELQKVRCPFCSGEVQSKQHKSLSASAKKELKNVRAQLKELQAVMAANNEEIERIKAQISTLEEERSALNSLIDAIYKVQVEDIQGSIHDLEELQRMKARREYIEKISKELDSDIQAYENGKETPISYDAKSLLGDAFYVTFNQYLEDALTTCKYESFMSCHLSKPEFDIIVDGKKKRNQGKGYRAFLNTVSAYCILKLLYLRGTYSPGMLILDSPILSLKEKDEQTSAEMKENLFRMILDTEFPCQIIIAENDIPAIDYSKANLIHFTKVAGLERYGFLKEV